MEVFRLSRAEHAIPLSGRGAAIKGARWNSIGVELIYTAQNRSLAMAEVAVHFTLATLPNDYVLMTIDIPENIAFQKVKISDLPKDWKEFPNPNSTQKIGDDFILKNKYCIMLVPLVVTQGDFNVLINPYHKDFNRIAITKVEKFPFNNRIFE